MYKVIYFLNMENQFLNFLLYFIYNFAWKYILQQDNKILEFKYLWFLIVF